MRKHTYRPISLLPAVSKVFECIMHDQLFDYIGTFFSPLLVGYNTQHVLLNFLQKFKASRDDKELAGAILMGLSKAFDCINHYLLIAKLAAYGLSWDALRPIKN